MSQFEQMFKEEAYEQLEIAEQALLSYESTPEKEFVEEAFRALHTFKGAAHMFSFKVLGDFAHKIESILDGIRQGIMMEEYRVTDRLLEYIDHLKKLIVDPEIKDKKSQTRNEVLQKDIDKLSSRVSDLIKEKGQQKEKALLETFIEQEDQEHLSTYYISINPIVEITSDSGHPLLNIITDLQDLGSTRLTSQYDQNNKSIFIHWDLYISCQSTKEELESQFMFIDDDVEVQVHKVANFDLFKEFGFEDFLGVLEKTENEKKLEEINAYVLSLKETVSDENIISDSSENNQKAKSIRISTEKIDVLMNLVSELVTDQASLKMFASNIQDPVLEGVSENMDRHIRQLRDIAFEMTLVPIERMMGKFRRMVRDCSVNAGKEVRFIVRGENTELDKVFIDSLSDPIMHILRNSIDHGIERPEDRKAKGKPESGTIQLEAYYSGANVHIEISDDGKGLNADIIRKKAIEKGLIDEEREPGISEVYQLIFEPGFSTANTVSNVSGRGVGMDVVKKNIEAIRGEINIESKLNQGLKIIIKVPLTLSIIDGLLIKSGSSHFLLPMQVINKCYEVRNEELLGNFNKLLIFDEEQIPYIHLCEELFLSGSTAKEYCNAIVIQCRERKVAILTDEIIGEYQAVLKPVGEHYKNQEFVSGATILGDGKVALVLDANKLVEQKSKQTTA